jgi:hypothetical protein
MREMPRRRTSATRAGVMGCALVCAAAWAAGCTSSRTPQPAPTPATARPPAVATPEAGGYPPRFIAGHAAYEISAIGLVSDPSDSVARQDTVMTTTTLTYDTRPSGRLLEVSGEILSRVAAASAALRHGDPAGGTRTLFHATIDTASGAVTVAPDTTAPLAKCLARDPSVDQARQLATTRPRSFIPAATWRDVVTDSSCLGGVPLVTHSARDYAVAPQPGTDPVSGAAAVLIAHTSATTMVGGGHRAGHYITLNGSGTGATEEYYDRKTGLLLSAHTTATLDLDITVSGRAQRLHQQADWQAKMTGGGR